MKTALSVVLLALLCLPAGADKGKYKPPAVPPATVTGALNLLVGKSQIVGVTETNGMRFLGRVLSGDHGLYMVQTFHFAGPPNVTTQATTYTTGSGKRRRTMHGTTRLYTETTIPDDNAVRMLMSGVAGATLNPLEVAGPRVMLTATDVKFLQTLSPPISPKLPKAPAGQPVIVSPTAARQLGWTMTTLWPTTK